ncbi:DUF1080 domain-containing protein [Phragmitibacter flavus]|uniref:DUF1080 domain-containing protein n=1 Tax=Phragmitibacter flavus TaxID=2576071 RepID=A0A5R8KAM9_9BACT|nr:DUF1080 domain-containing protein [Phragmitibacter flavus]TLD69363.1 DUF1080 domain-containing protein [Phragmitibacter flavus]
MKHVSFIVAVGALAFGLGGAQAEEGKAIFNGKDLSGWEGSADLWSVEDGAITGKTKPSEADPKKGHIKHNTFLIWRDGKVGDFELTFKYRMVGGNSGLQYRSKELEAGESGPVMSGYQADFEAGTKYSGILYEEKGRGILAERGQQTVIKPQEKDAANPKSKPFKVEVTGSVGDSAAIQAAIKSEDWNEYKIVAKGNHVQHFINGLKTAEVTDEDAGNAPKEGLLGFQIHVGPPMVVQFKDVILKETK